MKLFDWFLETFPTPRRVRERREQLRARRTSQASQWTARYFPAKMQRAASAVAFAICEVNCKDTATFDPTDRLIEDLKMTDLEPLQLVLNLESDFDIQIPDSDVVSLATVVGGFFGVFGLLFIPVGLAHKLCWLPLVLDWGSLPGMLHFMIAGIIVPIIKLIRRRS